MQPPNTTPYFPPLFFQRASLLYRLRPIDPYDEILLDWWMKNSDLILVFAA